MSREMVQSRRSTNKQAMDLLRVIYNNEISAKKWQEMGKDSSSAE